MMKSEFIERTGFEPTEAEYREIEAEYMGCDIDKDEFCKTWNRDMEQRGRTYRKNHGIHCRKRTCRGRDSDRHE